MGSQKKKKPKSTPFILIEKTLLKSNEWAKLSSIARDLYLELKCNYNGYNNGQLIASYTYIRKKYGYGYGTISKGFRELISNDFISQTQRGELAGLFGKKANAYKLTGKYEKIVE